MINSKRRFILQAMAASTVLSALPLRSLAAASSERPMPGNKELANFIRHNELPWALETRRSSFGFGPITAESHFFVRNNLPMPPPSINDNPDDWRISIKGAKSEGEITVAQLKTLDIRTVATVLQCSGNGRAFFPHKPAGSPWALGAAGCALWTGVRVADVLEHFGGVKSKPAFLTTTGGETLPEGIDKDAVAVERSIPLDKGLDDCLLVWEMNGAPLSLAHGGPLRLIVPGYFGVNNVKWVKQLAVTEQESAAKIQQSGYRIRPIGEKGGPAHPSMWRMPVKSWLNGPGADELPVLAGANVLYGVAFSGERGIKKIEVSGDGGRSWKQAEFVGPDLGINAWRAFKLVVNLPVGQHRYVSRATDNSGDVQPENRIENHRGYGNNSWLDAGLTIHAVKKLPAKAQVQKTQTVVAAPAKVVAAKPVELSAQAQKGRDIFMKKAQPACSVCHTLADAGAAGSVGPNLNTLKPTADQVSQAVAQGVGIMPAFGSQLSDVEIAAVAVYVFEATR